MIYKFLLFLTITSQVACAQHTQLNSSKPFSFVDSLFTKENYTVEILDFVFPNDIQEILLRLQKSMAEKKEWSETYFSKNYKAGEGLPYHENFGVTKEEYQKIKDLDKSPPNVIIKSTASIKIIRTSGLLSFEAIEEDVKFIEALSIDFKNELLTFINDTIPFSNQINTTGSTPLGEWHGYSWKKEISNLKDEDDLKMDSLISKIVEIHFGRVSANNKIFLRLKYKEVNKGEIKANFDMACYLN